MVPEAPLESTKFGLRPGGPGWFVVSARETAGGTRARSAHCDFEGKRRFPDFGININVLQPGQSLATYHRENAQEDFLVLAGECILIVDDEERKLKQWDLFHCPPQTEHVIVGAGKGPSVVLAVGARGRRRKGIVYPVSETALKHGAGVEKETTDPSKVYESRDWKRTLTRTAGYPICSAARRAIHSRRRRPACPAGRQTTTGPSDLRRERRLLKHSTYASVLEEGVRGGTGFTRETSERQRAKCLSRGRGRRRRSGPSRCSRSA